MSLEIFVNLTNLSWNKYKPHDFAKFCADLSGSLRLDPLTIQLMIDQYDSSALKTNLPQLEAARTLTVTRSFDIKVSGVDGDTLLAKNPQRVNNRDPEDIRLYHKKKKTEMLETLLEMIVPIKLRSKPKLEMNIYLESRISNTSW